MSTSRITRTTRTTTRTVVSAATVLVAAAGLTACGGQPTPAPEQKVRPGLNRMEHEAHRQLADVLKQQSEALNPREHLAHRDTDEVVPDVKPGEHLAQAPRS